MGLVVHLNPFREALGISWPTHFTDVETEGQSVRHMAKSPQPGLQTLLLHVLSRAHLGRNSCTAHSPWRN